MIDPLIPSKYETKRTITVWDIYKNNAINAPNIIYYRAKRITITLYKKVTTPKTHEMKNLDPYQPDSVVQHNITFKEKTRTEEVFDGTLDALGEMADAAEIIGAFFEAIGSIFEALG